MRTSGPKGRTGLPAGSAQGVAESLDPAEPQVPCSPRGHWPPDEGQSEGVSPQLFQARLGLRIHRV